jgi:hypothetical protein
MRRKGEAGVDTGSRFAAIAGEGAKGRRAFPRPAARTGAFNNGAALESLGDKAVAAEDQAILDAYAAEVLSRPVSATAMSLDATDDSGTNADG